MREEYFHDGNLTPTATAALWTSLADEVRGSIVAEAARWGDSTGGQFTLGDWEAVNLKLLTEYFPARTNIVLGQLMSIGLYPGVDAPEFIVENEVQYGGSVSAGQTLGFSGVGGTLTPTAAGLRHDTADQFLYGVGDEDYAFLAHNHGYWGAKVLEGNVYTC